ncbi:hypothetical protein [Plebeiibacterium marinum]|uniref:Uncharacterized protein n=1 Tax=Plebeiibacterium marinum TaxID=2992111 RepID=A0AAE3SIK6_9BACT|nr:hypothetical protein [Plebeiobacterium marinum]MCW3804533.1 hypothetical protein [Plebeiobacterium marinum]
MYYNLLRLLACSVVFSFFFFTSISSQGVKSEKNISDSIKMAYMEKLALKNPMIRQFSMTSELIPHRNISSKLYGKDFIKGDATIYRNSMLFKMPVKDWKNSSLSSSASVLNQKFSMHNMTHYDDPNTTYDLDFSKTTLGLSLNYNVRGKLFNKPVMYNTSITGVTDPSFSEYDYSFTGVMMFTLKRTQTTTLSLGGVVLISPGVKIPGFMMVSYTHQFNKNLELSANLPYRLALRQELNTKNSLSFINEMSGSKAFFNIDNRYFPEKSSYGTSEIKSGLLYERRLGRKFVLGLSAGALYTATSEMKENNTWDDSYFIKNKSTLDAYFDINISLLPFINW